ncbi:MAG: metallophosphoesterase family protein [Clostridia bacterium]|nr:metallophosphoesterase family protein [Clostridia bacterium]
MLIILGVLLALIVVAIGFCLFFFFKRMLSTFGVDVKNKWVKVVVVALAVVFALLSAYIMNVASVVILHVVIIGLIIQFFNFIIKKIFRHRYDGFDMWKKIYGSGVLPILLTILIIITANVNLHNIVETNYTVYTDKSIRSQGYRVALVADVHFGVSLTYDELVEKCEQISARDVDVLALCGDIVDNSTSTEQMEEVFTAFSNVRTKYGVYYVYGNHDRPMNMLTSEYTSDELINVIKNCGITILRDSVVRIADDFVMIGREDAMTRDRLPLNELLLDVDKNSFVLTLDHQPNQYAENGKEGTDLLLSGHTHGGQLFPINIIMKVFGINDGVYGLYQIDSDTQAVVTSGFAGWNYPVKNAAPAEYVIIDILPN